VGVGRAVRIDMRGEGSARILQAPSHEIDERGVVNDGRWIGVRRSLHELMEGRTGRVHQRSAQQARNATGGQVARKHRTDGRQEFVDQTLVERTGLVDENELLTMDRDVTGYERDYGHRQVAHARVRQGERPLLTVDDPGRLPSRAYWNGEHSDLAHTI